MEPIQFVQSCFPHLLPRSQCHLVWVHVYLISKPLIYQAEDSYQQQQQKKIYPFAFLRSFKKKSKWIPPAFQQITREYCTLEGCWDLVRAHSAPFTNKWEARKSPSLRCWVFRSPEQENTWCSLVIWTECSYKEAGLPVVILIKFTSYEIVKHVSYLQKPHSLFGGGNGSCDALTLMTWAWVPQNSKELMVSFLHSQDLTLTEMAGDYLHDNYQ